MGERTLEMDSVAGEKLPKPLRVAFQTLGCRGNFADTLDLQAMVSAQGGLPCDFDSEADVYVLNSCTVTDAADKEGLRLLRRMRRRHPAAKLVVTGCLAQVGREKLEGLGVELVVVPVGQREKLLEVIFSNSLLPPEDNRGRDLDRPLGAQIPAPGALLGETKMRGRFHLRVQDGCQSFCSYCIVPFARGELRSRSIDNILQCITMLKERGYQEVVLTGTHLGAWGRESGLHFIQLLRALAEKSEIPRLRISSVHPNEITEELIDVLSNSNVFCRHLHISVQAFDDVLLGLMRRHYTLEDLRRVLGELVQRLPGICLGADVICGFPGESERQFEEGVKVFLDLPLSYLHVFPFSVRQGSAAADLASQVPKELCLRRAQILRELSRKRKKAFYENFSGKRLEVIVEEHCGTVAYGTSREYLRIRLGLDAERRELPIGSEVTCICTAYDEDEEVGICV